MNEQKSNPIDDLPVLKGVAIHWKNGARSGCFQSLVYCPWCGRVHVHGVPDGDRSAHCDSEDRMQLSAYLIETVDDWEQLPPLAVVKLRRAISQYGRGAKILGHFTEEKRQQVLRGEWK